MPDQASSAGGVSTLLRGHYINPHLDKSHDATGTLYRTINLLYYVSPNWSLGHGGHYELWDEAVEYYILVPYVFNRLLITESNQSSWHAVNKVRSSEPRRCVFNYLFSKQSPEKEDYFRDTLFCPRPEQIIRRNLRAFKKSVFG